MARYIGPSCKLCRAAGEKLFLKGDRCYTSKCAIERRKSKPGGRSSRKNETGYATQLKEKQKIKRMYGLLEKQFYLYFEKATVQKGITGEILLQLLERRLDNVVYRLGLAKSRAQARQIVKHGYLKVNDKKVDIPSFLVSKGDAITHKEMKLMGENVKDAKAPAWLQKSNEGYVVAELPARADSDASINEKMVVEFYSR